MDLNNVSDELKAKALACKTPEELLELAKTEGYELSDDDLEAIAGGGIDWDCLMDGCTNVKPW